MIAGAVPEGRWALAAAAATWAGALVGVSSLPHRDALAAGLALSVFAGLRRRPAGVLMAALVVAGAISGAAANQRIAATLDAEVTPGPAAFSARVASDPAPGYGAWRLLVAPSGRAAQHPVVMVESEVQPEAVAGDVVDVRGELRAVPGRLRGDPYAGMVANAEVVVRQRAGDPAFRLGNALRATVLDRLRPHLDRPAAALLAGFLVGDTSALDERDLDDLRASGLTHYVAVSGSNVALFLAAWWLATGPLPLSPRFRSATGMGALVVFVVATRWEPSVVRAATMAGVVLGGRLLGFPVGAWRALGSAVTLLLLVSGDLAVDVGFQLSAGATAGVLVGGALPLRRRPQWLWRSLVVTLGAQLAVLPVLLATFGTVPLMSPVANLAAAPLVTVATAAGAIGVLANWDGLLQPALLAADGVLAVAHTAAAWPQLGLLGAGAALGAAVALRWRLLRPAVVAAGAMWLVVGAIPPQAGGPALTFLDVGQGDAIVVRPEIGDPVLVDGGADPSVLAAALGRIGVDRIELLVVTHGDQDHVGGLEDVFTWLDVGEVWYPDLQARSPALDALLEAAGGRGVPLRAVRAGAQRSFDTLHLQVLGPGRRYAGENDGSVVLWVSGVGVSALLTGDIEAVAQAELPELRPDVLQVPHHGSATSDLRWLAVTAGDVAVVSVGPNSFGHPVPAVLEQLATAGAAVFLTQRDGDVTVPLCRACAP